MTLTSKHQRIQKKCSLCLWFKCEQITQLNFPSKTIFYNLIEFPMTKKLFKIQYISHLRLNFEQFFFINPYLMEACSNNIKIVLKFSYNYWFLFNYNFSGQFVPHSITSPWEAQTLWNQLGAPLLIEVFLKILKSAIKGVMVWKISTWQTNKTYKTNKQPSLLDKLV